MGSSSHNFLVNYNDKVSQLVEFERQIMSKWMSTFAGGICSNTKEN